MADRNYKVTFWSGARGSAVYVEDGEFIDLKTARKYAQLWAHEGQAAGFARVASVWAPVGKRQQRHVESTAFEPGRGVFTFKAQR